MVYEILRRRTRVLRFIPSVDLNVQSTTEAIKAITAKINASGAQSTSAAPDEYVFLSGGQRVHQTTRKLVDVQQAVLLVRMLQ